jgi:uncharacterized protein YbjT (DUF2867 family)
MKIIITGATGMVGEGVMHECLLHQDVTEVLVINRRPGGVVHPKLKEIVRSDLFDLSAVQHDLSGYDACFFCLGVSSVGMKAEEYFTITYTLTLRVAEVLSRASPGMTFCYVSGAGTDSSEKGRSRWARVKGKTENDLQQLPFDRVYNFRPGFIRPTPGLSNAHSFYKYIGWLYPLGRALYPAGFCTLRELGTAMIRVVNQGFSRPVVEGKDIITLAGA